jgi:hypothetical protein
MWTDETGGNDGRWMLLSWSLYKQSKDDAADGM